MKQLPLLLLVGLVIGCGGSGGSGGGGTPPPPPPPAFAPPGDYFGTIDWTGNDESCKLTVHDNGLGLPSGEVTLSLSGGTAGVTGTLISGRLSLLGTDQFGQPKSVELVQTEQGNVQIVRQEVNNTVINVVGPQ